MRSRAADWCNAVCFLCPPTRLRIALRRHHPAFLPLCALSLIAMHAFSVYSAIAVRNGRPSREEGEPRRCVRQLSGQRISSRAGKCRSRLASAKRHQQGESWRLRPVRQALEESKIDELILVFVKNEFADCGWSSTEWRCSIHYASTWYLCRECGYQLFQGSLVFQARFVSLAYLHCLWGITSQYSFRRFLLHHHGLYCRRAGQFHCRALSPCTQTPLCTTSQHAQLTVRLGSLRQVPFATSDLCSK